MRITSVMVDEASTLKTIFRNSGRFFQVRRDDEDRLVNDSLVMLNQINFLALPPRCCKSWQTW
jgi:hypothetical protein